MLQVAGYTVRYLRQPGVSSPLAFHLFQNPPSPPTRPLLRPTLAAQLWSATFYFLCCLLIGSLGLCTYTAYCFTTDNFPYVWPVKVRAKTRVWNGAPAAQP